MTVERSENGAPPAEAGPAGEQQPKYVTEEQLHAGLATFEQKLQKSLSGTLGTFAERLKGELGGLLGGAAGQAAPITPVKPEADQGAAPKDTPTQTPELKRLQEQIAQLTRQNEEARAERDAERTKARDATRRQRLLDALAPHGVEGARARHAAALLIDSEQRVRWSEEGDAVIFRTADRGDVDLAAGVKEWLKTDDGKFYLPARGASGSGDRPGAAAPPRAAGTPPDRTAVADGLRRALNGEIS